MSKLYPPIIEESLPAFYSENGVVKFTIPFSMNRAVSFAEIGGFELTIKTIQSGSHLYTVETYKPTEYSLEKDNLHVSFYIEDKEKKLKVGQFYKLQLAYIYVDTLIKNKYLSEYYEGKISIEEFEIALSQRKEVGYYSGAGIAKYTTKPKLYISNLRTGFLNSYTNSYTGCYDQISTEDEYKDSSEKVYYYKFDIYGSDGKELLLSTGHQLHNTSLDSNIDYSEDIYNLNKDMAYNTIYYIQYSVITINGLELSTPKYKLIQRELIDAFINVDISATLNEEEGYIDIRLLNKKDEIGLYELVTGAFKLLRSDGDSQYKDWVEVTRFKLNEEIPSSDEILFRDYTVIQGKKYQYAVQQYNDTNLYSNKIYSDIIQANFEHAFLFDGVRQLKIKYNTKMSKFTNTRLEQKIDTIGGQYPFIFRNGHVNYHEFPIGGLISYFMDEENLFMYEHELNSLENTINYTYDNIAKERIFKMKVLEWLNDGTPKIFRSPTEGNFIIRLLKVSMSPEQKLGRLLHNFSGTAYEIAEYTYENLLKYNFIYIPDDNDNNNNILNFETIDLRNVKTGVVINQDHQNIQTLHCENMIPGEELLITFVDGSQEIITIGVTGRYYLNNNLEIQSIVVVPQYSKVAVLRANEFNQDLYYIKNDSGTLIPAKEQSETMDVLGTYYKQINTKLEGYITYNFFIVQPNTFGSINNVQMNDCSLDQFIGEYDILKEISSFRYSDDIYLDNPKRRLTQCYSMRVRPRPLEYFDRISKDIYFYKNVVNNAEKHPFSLYYEKNAPSHLGNYIDFSNNNKRYQQYESYVSINNEKIYITHDTNFDLTQFETITELSSSNGVVIEILYQTKNIEYIIETTNADIIKAKQDYEKSKQIYDNYLGQKNIRETTLNTYYNNMIQDYKDYIKILNEVLQGG